MDIIITNNQLVKEKYNNAFDLHFIEGTLLDVLTNARDLVHAGHALLTHPLSGSVKPNETPFKTVLLSGGKNGLDARSLEIIEQSILTVNKFTPRPLKEQYIPDFQQVDLALIRPALER